MNIDQKVGKVARQCCIRCDTLKCCNQKCTLVHINTHRLSDLDINVMYANYLCNKIMA